MPCYVAIVGYEQPVGTPKAPNQIARNADFRIKGLKTPNAAVVSGTFTFAGVANTLTVTNGGTDWFADVPKAWYSDTNFTTGTINVTNTSASDGTCSAQSMVMVS